MAANINLWDIYGDMIVKQGVELLKKEEVKSNLKEQYRVIIRTVLSEIGLWLYLLVGCIFFMFIMLSIILIMLVVRSLGVNVIHRRDSDNNNNIPIYL